MHTAAGRVYAYQKSIPVMICTIENPKPAESSNTCHRHRQRENIVTPDRAVATKEELTDHMRLHMPLPTYVCQVAGAWRVKPLYVTS